MPVGAILRNIEILEGYDLSWFEICSILIKIIFDCDAILDARTECSLEHSRCGHIACFLKAIPTALLGFHGCLQQLLQDLRGNVFGLRNCNIFSSLLHGLQITVCLQVQVLLNPTANSQCPWCPYFSQR